MWKPGDSIVDETLRRHGDSFPSWFFDLLGRRQHRISAYQENPSPRQTYHHHISFLKFCYYISIYIYYNIIYIIIYIYISHISFSKFLHVTFFSWTSMPSPSIPIPIHGGGCPTCCRGSVWGWPSCCTWPWSSSPRTWKPRRRPGSARPGSMAGDGDAGDAGGGRLLHLKDVYM